MRRGAMTRPASSSRATSRFRSTLADHLLEDCGVPIRRLVAGLSMPDWPERARRAMSFTLTPYAILPAAAGARIDALLELCQQSDGVTFDDGGD